jgi:hypothetical protein
MIKVYFEKNGYAVLVAEFLYEETYVACLDALEANCKKLGYDFVTETVEE